MNTSPAEALKQTTQEILTLWENEVRKKIPAAKAETRASLRDSIPEFLEDLIRALETNFDEQTEDLLKFAHKHGRERANGSNYSIEDAITEYNILRRVIFNVLEDKCEIHPRERDIIYEAISLALAKAGAEYAKTQINETRILNTRLHLILESSDIGLYSLDLRTGIITLSEKEAKILGTGGRTEVMFPDVEKLVHPDDIEKLKSELDKCISGELPSVKLQHRLLRPDGSVRWVTGTGKVIFDTEGEPTHLIGTNIDFTESKVSRDTIRNLAERLQLITDIQPTLILYLDNDMNYVFANKTFSEWFDRDPSTVIGKNTSEMFTKEEFEYLKSKTREAYNGKKIRFKHYVNYPAGRKFVDVTYQPHIDDAGNVMGIFVSVDDLTEEKTIIDELRTEKDLRDKFVSTLSHDLRTPLTASKMSAQIIARKITDPQIQTHTTRIVDNINRADKLIQDLLDAGKIRAGKLVIPETEEFDLVHLVHMTLEDLTTIHGDRFRFTSPDRLVVNLHAEGIRRILENLCTNAIKYGSTQEPVKIKISPREDKLIMSVSNSGNPLVHIDKEKLFEPFEQGNSQQKGGWGIGFTIVKGITEAHGGTVQVESNVNTTFTVTLPQDARPFLAHHLH